MIEFVTTQLRLSLASAPLVREIKHFSPSLVLLIQVEGEVSVAPAKLSICQQQLKMKQLHHGNRGYGGLSSGGDSRRTAMSDVLEHPHLYGRRACRQSLQAAVVSGFAERGLHVQMHLAKNDGLRGKEPCGSCLSPQIAVWLNWSAAVTSSDENAEV
jgi:hypothetical protein